MNDYNLNPNKIAKTIGKRSCHHCKKDMGPGDKIPDHQWFPITSVSKKPFCDKVCAHDYLEIQASEAEQLAIMYRHLARQAMSRVK